MQRFGILGPPSILFFGVDGDERQDYRVVGFKPAEDVRAARRTRLRGSVAMNGRVTDGLVAGAAALVGAAGLLPLSRARRPTAPPRRGSARRPGGRAGHGSWPPRFPAFQLADRDGAHAFAQGRLGRQVADRSTSGRPGARPAGARSRCSKQLARDHAGDNVQVIGIAVDFRDKVVAYADEMQIDYPMLIGEQDALDAAAAFGVDAFGLPFTIFTDASGRVITLHMGELTAAEADIILAAVRDVDAGRSDPLQARAAITAGLAALPPVAEAKGGG